MWCTRKSCQLPSLTSSELTIADRTPHDQHPPVCPLWCKPHRCLMLSLGGYKEAPPWALWRLWASLHHTMLYSLDVHLKEVFRRCVSDGSCPDPSILSNFDLNEPVAQARGCQAPLAWINSVLGKENARSPSKHLIHTNAKPTGIANTFKNMNFPGDIIYTLHHFFLFLWFSKRV